MNKQTKITLDELMRRKIQMLEAKKQQKTATLHIKSLDGTITIKSPSVSLAQDCVDMQDGDTYLVQQCVVDPPLKSQQLQEEFGCTDPLDLVRLIFEPGEIPQIAQECLRLAGYGNDSVTLVEEIKN